MNQLILVHLPPHSVPAKRKQRLSPIPDSKRGCLATQTPPKQVYLLSSPRCPPSPHHKPRASSPLRESAISPTVFIHRPEKRKPLGELAISVQENGHKRRISSKELKFYENSSPRKFTDKLVRAKSLSPLKPSSKENVLAFPRLGKETLMDDAFMRTDSRGALTDSTEDMDVVEEKTVEETVTREFASDARVIRETSRRTVSTKIVKHLHFKTDFSTSAIKDDFSFEIFQDPDDSILRIEELSQDDLDIGEGDDKENEEPCTNSYNDEMESENRRKKVKIQQEDWS